MGKPLSIFIHGPRYETRELVESELGDDALFFFDRHGIAYERVSIHPETFAEVSSGKRWWREVARG